MLSGLVPFRAKSKIALQKQILTAKFKLESEAESCLHLSQTLETCRLPDCVLQVTRLLWPHLIGPTLASPNH